MGLLPLGSAGKELAHWYYEPYEWEYYVWGEWRRTKSELQEGYRIVFAVLSAFLVLVGIVSLITANWVAAITGMLWLGVPNALFIGAIYYFSYRSKRNWFRRLHKASPEVIITDEAVVFGGPDYTRTELIKATRAFGLTAQAAVEGGDFGMLVFEMTDYLTRGSRTELRVLIPNGKQAEAEQVAILFRR